MRELFTTGRHPALSDAARAAGVPVWSITEAGLESLAQTVTPQGIIAVCEQRHHSSVTEVLAARPALVVVLAGIADPGNAGTVLRTADAAAAGAVVFPAGSVDPYNGKCVRASAGSLFHVEIVRGGAAADAVAALRADGMAVLAADVHASDDLDDYADSDGLSRRTAWLFGGEAHGLPEELAQLADARIRVPIYGRAESLNLAAAAAICLYASARALRRMERS